MIKAILLVAAVAIVIDGDSKPLDRPMECLTVDSVGDVTLELRGDEIFSDGFEGGTTVWIEPSGGCPPP